MRFRILGIVILACGLAVCRGAYLLWPEAFDASLASFAMGALRIAAAALAAVIGVLNVVAGTIVLLRPARD